MIALPRTLYSPLRRKPALCVLAALCLGSLGQPATAFAQLRASVYVTGLSTPLEFVQNPADPSVQYVVEQGGRIRVIVGGALQAASFLDLTGQISSGGERGLLGLAFPPDFATSRRFFVNFTDPNGNTVVARFRAPSNAAADAASRLDLQWSTGQRFIVQPFANHNGGHLAFGPDGFLYIGMGDGGSSNDPNNYAQTPGSLLGKMLRIDVNVSDADTKGFQIPSGNPFSGSPGYLPEIWSFGLRNPWKFSFDDPARGGTGAMIIADVGQNAWEEIDYEPRARAGRNYGWRRREGRHDNVTSLPAAYLPLTEPILEYSHSIGSSITGGYVYRGSVGAPYQGRYVFGDFISGRVWSIGLVIDGSGEALAVDFVEHTAELGGGAVLGNISSFGADAGGELYIVSYSRGQVLKVAATPLPSPTGFKIVLP